MRKQQYITLLVTILVSLPLLVACHTTSRLQEGEVLYTGVKHLKINIPDSVEVPDGIVDNIKSAINVPANNSLYSPYVRSPLPIGLWIYNHWPDDAKGLKGWIYRKFAEEPVLMSDVRPDLRTKMIEGMLANNGFFNSTTSYNLIYNKKNPKKARVNYTVNLSKPKVLAHLLPLTGNSELDSLINRFARQDNALKPEMIFCVDSLSAATERISDKLRNRGFYYFQPQYISFLADSTLIDGKIVLQTVYAEAVPEKARRKYYVGNITTNILRNDGTGSPDTIQTEAGTIVCWRPAKMREGTIASCIAMKKGGIIKMRQVSNTQAYLSRLGIFNAVSVNLAPLDSVKSDTLDVVINCRFDKPLETEFELNLSSKSNSYLGPGASFSVAHKNIFGGAERLTITADVAYEWQIGKVEEGKKRSDFNSYEVGLNAELAFPRLLAPRFLKSLRRELSWTRFSLGGNIMNRPHFFKMVQANLGFGYEWMASRSSKHKLNIFDLKYNKLISTTYEFEMMMFENPAIALSFDDQFVAKLSYSYSFNKVFGNRRLDRRRLSIETTLTDGGNILSGIWSLAGFENGKKRLFDTPFSQFIKATFQTVYSHRLTPQQQLVGRVFVGVAHAYGNSYEVPYTEQFYVGGANSLRAFAVRSIGPGSYVTTSENSSGYYDQTGTFRFEANMEYRFPIVGMLKGALFVDTGNIWLIKDDPLRPGGKLSSNFFKDLALGTGLGLRFDMGMMVIRGDLGVGIHLPYDTGKSGYYNMKSFGKSLAFNIAIGYPF